MGTAPAQLHIEPFTIAIDEAVLDDLRRRIQQTRWPDQLPGIGWEQGAELSYLRELLASWADGFDWRAQERLLNRLNHFRAELDGLGIHFVHQRGNSAAPIPLVLTHGWPSSFLEPRPRGPLLSDPIDRGSPGPGV